jgi:hypothetical protein
MRRIAVLIVLTVYATGAFTTSAKADCSDAISSYNSAISDIETKLKSYARCVASSNGADDCSSEFRRLRSSQGDFESAVSDYQLYCRR